MLGVSKDKVVLEPYNSNWVTQYEDERAAIMDGIGGYIIDIQHVGSTSIPNLDAKPIIDIAVGIEELDVGTKFIEPLKKIGYEYRSDAGVKGRHFFAKGSAESRTHYLHVEIFGGELWENHILFRDYLREHGDVMEQYRNIKKELAGLFYNDRGTYTSRKTDFIANVLERAKQELIDRKLSNR